MSKKARRDEEEEFLEESEDTAEPEVDEDLEVEESADGEEAEEESEFVSEEAGEAADFISEEAAEDSDFSALDADADEEPAEDDDNPEEDGKGRAKSAGADDDFLMDDADDMEEAVDKSLPAKVTTTTLVLCLLNLLAVGGFLYLLLLDFQKRQSWSYAIFLRDLQIQGLPLKEEATTFTASRELRPVTVIDPEAVMEEYTGRRTGVRVDKFQQVREVLQQRITPEQLQPGVLKDHFQGVEGPPVQTLQEELERMAGQLPTDIEKAATDALDQIKALKRVDDQETQKRRLLEKMLLPIASNVFQIEAMNRRIQAVKDAGLDALLLDACQRRMLYDILRPLDEFRPTDTKDKRLHDAVDLDKVKLEQMKEALRERFAEADAQNAWDGRGRESYEKRRSIAALLFAISQVKTPKGELLYPKGAERVEAVVGLYEYNQAVATHAVAIQKIRDRIWQHLTEDRVGRPLVTADGKETLQQEFVGRQAETVKRILDTVALIKNREVRLGVIKQLEQQHKTQLDERKKHHDTVVADLLKARSGTAKAVAELQRLEQQLFAAQLELADAAETNQRLEAEIRQLELYPRLRGQR